MRRQEAAAEAWARDRDGAGAIEWLTSQLTRFVRALHALKARDGQDRSSLLLLPRMEERSCRLRTLAESVHADPSTVSRQVSELVELGLVRREADPRDGRASLLAITPRGREACDELRRRRGSVLEAVLADWPVERVEALSSLLSAFTDAVEASMRDEAGGRSLRTPGGQPSHSGDHDIEENL